MRCKDCVHNIERLLQTGGLEMEHVDWIVCNSGADIWHNFRDGAAEGKAGWHADESWEEHINFRCPERTLASPHTVPAVQAWRGLSKDLQARQAPVQLVTQTCAPSHRA